MRTSSALLRGWPHAEMALFGYSILYPGLLFIATVADRLVG